VTTTEIPLTTVKFEDIPDYTDLGTYKLTAYCSCSKCCGKSDGITASGTKATAGRTVAAKGIPFGTKLMINGETYIVEDRGVGSGVIDIYFDSHSEALNFGVKYAKVFEVN
jgi:3D (Asp-Asp-Asp) domain-containing protein